MKQINLTIQTPSDIELRAETFEEFVSLIDELGIRDQITDCHDVSKNNHLAIRFIEEFPEEGEKALIDLFIQSMDDDYERDRDGRLIIEQYWDYRDNISSKTMENDILPTLKQYRKENEDFTKLPFVTQLERVLDEYVMDYDWLHEDCYFNTHWDRFVYYFEEYDTQTHQHIAFDWFYDHVTIKHNSMDLLKNNYPEDLVLYFEHDTIYSFAKELAASQGYPDFDPEQYLDNAEICYGKDTFLYQLYDEIYGYYTTPYVEQFTPVALPQSTDWVAIAELYCTGKGVIKAGTEFGFFNSFSGSGTGVEVKLEKDIVLSENGPIVLDELKVAKSHERFNYSPTVVYGMNRSYNEEQLESIKE